MSVEAPPGAARPAALAPEERSTSPGPGAGVVLGVAAACVAVWLWSLSGVRLEDTAGWGLLDSLPPSWFVAFAGVVLLYGAVLLSRRPVTHTLAAVQVVLVALLFATTSAVYDAARYPWTFKHVGVVEYLMEHGAIDRSIDIYHNFPGFFALAAWLHDLTGIPVLDLAQWSQPVFALLTSAAVYWAVGGLSSSRRVRYGAVLLYTLGDWIGQNYFAPQALAFPVALLVIGGVLRSVNPGAEGLRWDRLRRFLPPVTGDDAPRPSRFWRSPWGSAVVVAAFAVVAVTHPLTPVVLLAQVTLLYVVFRPARPWLPLLLAAVEAFWMVQAWPFLTSTYELFSFGLGNVEPPQVSVVEPPAGYETALWAAPVLMLTLGLLAAATGLAALRQRDRAARMIAPLALAAVPIAMVLAQPYGNEGIFRAYLFALPWMAYVVAQQVRDAHPTWTTSRRGVAVGVLGVLAVLTLPANFAGELSYRVAASDVAADIWFEERTPVGSVLLPFASPFPWRVTADYPDHLPIATQGVDGVSDLDGFTAAARDASTLLVFTEDACDTRPGSGPVYVALGPSAVDDVLLHGVMPMSTYRDYERALAASPTFTRVFTEGDSTLFRCRD